MKCSLGISNFLEEISKSFPFYYFPLFLCIDCWGRLSYFSLLFFVNLHSNGNIFPFLLCLLLLFFSQLFVRPPQKIILPFCISFSWGWSWSLPPVQCHEPPSIVLQALCLSELIPWIHLSFHCLIISGFMSFFFFFFFQFQSEFGNKEFMIWATVSSWSCFCWLYRASPSLAAKNMINLILVLTIWWCPCVESSLVLLTEGVCYDQCILLAKLC